MAPILADMLPAAKEIAKIQKQSKEVTEDEKFDQIAELAAPIMNGLSKLSEEDSEKVLIGLLSAVEIKQASGNWARIANDNRMMFDNLDLSTLLQIAGRAFMFNLSGFFSALPQASHGGR